MPRLTQFSLENFRVFEQKTTFEFAPITILTGANSSGKSSVFKALNLLSENAKKGNFFGGLDFSLGNHNLGDFENVVNNKANEDKKEISFEFGISVLWTWEQGGNYNIEENDYEQCSTLDFKFLDKNDLYSNLLGDSKESEIKTYKVSFSWLKDRIVNINIKNDKNEVLLSWSEKGKGISKIQENATRIKCHSQISLQKILFEDKFFNTEILDIDKLDKIIGENPHKSEFYEILKGNILKQINSPFQTTLPYLENRQSILQYNLESNLAFSFLFGEPYFPKYATKNKSIKFPVFVNLIHETEEEFLKRIEMESDENLSFPEEREYFPARYLFQGDYAKFQSIIEKCGKLKLNQIINKDFANTCKTFFDFFSKIINFGELSYMQNGIQFIEGVRANSQRIYTYQSQGTSFNEFLHDVLLNKKKIDTDFVNTWLKEFGIADGFEINEIKGVASEVFLVKNGKKIDLVDLGYGITQVLPLILKVATMPDLIYYAGEELKTKYNIHEKTRTFEENHLNYVKVPIDGGNRFTICIEEPETNLHPKLQSKLADMLIDACKVFNVQFVVETHSEYLIRKLQYWVAKEEILPEDVNIYYLYNPDEVPKGRKQVERIRIEEDGYLDNRFGAGFFDEADSIALDISNL